MAPALHIGWGSEMEKKQSQKLSKSQVNKKFTNKVHKNHPKRERGTTKIRTFTSLTEPTVKSKVPEASKMSHIYTMFNTSTSKQKSFC